MRIAEVEKLKQLIVSDKEGAEKDLDEFIKDKCNKAEENKKMISDLINQYEAGYHFSLKEPNRIGETIKDSLKNSNFFEQSVD